MIQIYLEVIIFGIIDVCQDLFSLTHKEFEMSMIGELNSFLVSKLRKYMVKHSYITQSMLKSR